MDTLASIFSNHDGIKPQMNYKKKMRKITKIGRLQKTIKQKNRKIKKTCYWKTNRLKKKSKRKYKAIPRDK